MLGVTDEQYDMPIMNDKFKTYVGSLLAATSNPETGENPLFGQLAQGSLSTPRGEDADDGDPVCGGHRPDRDGRGR